MIRLTQSLNIIAVFVWVRAPLPFSLGTPPLQTIDAVLYLRVDWYSTLENERGTADLVDRVAHSDEPAAWLDVVEPGTEAEADQLLRLASDERRESRALSFSPLQASSPSPPPVAVDTDEGDAALQHFFEEERISQALDSNSPRLANPSSSNRSPDLIAATSPIIGQSSPSPQLLHLSGVSTPPAVQRPWLPISPPREETTDAFSCSPLCSEQLPRADPT